MAAKSRKMKNADFFYKDLLPWGGKNIPFRLIAKDRVKIRRFQGHDVLIVAPDALRTLAREAFTDVAFYVRPGHLRQLSSILKDPGSSDNDKTVALQLIKNAVISAERELPMCQDTGTAMIIGKKGQAVWTGHDDGLWLSRGVYDAYTKENLRYSQVIASTMYDEKNSGNNLPAQIEIFSVDGAGYDFLFIAKGGGSANKTFLFQETRALLSPKPLREFLVEKIRNLGTAACPPYHIAIVVGGTSAETCLKTVKLASAGVFDELPGKGDGSGSAFRDFELEKVLHEDACNLGLGAQFGGKYFSLDIRVIRLSRHGASLPIGIGVSCVADRNIRARIDRKGIWLEQLETRPGKYLPESAGGRTCAAAVAIDLNRPMKEILAQLSKHPVATRLLLTGRLIVARDIAHAKFKELLDRGEDLPRYFKDHPVYYAGPAKTPKGKASGSFGPTTSGRMDSYTDLFQKQGASMVMVGKGGRSFQVTEACRNNGGFYLGSTGGAAALLARESIRKVEVLGFPELGMESVWAIDVVDFPAWILIDDKGNDFFRR